MLIEKLSFHLEKVFKAGYTRKGFLKIFFSALGFILLSGKFGRKTLAAAGKKLEGRKKQQIKTNHDIVAAKGKDAKQITRKAVDNLGGMGKFVKKGSTVVVKPNIGWDRSPEQAGNTNPAVVAAVVEMCFEAGAKIVKVFDNTCNNSKRTYENSGIEAAVRKAGGTIFYFNDWKCYPAQMAQENLMNEWPIIEDAVKCDCFINVPVAKHHALTQLTLSIKNLMGVCGGARGEMHQNIDKKLVEITQFIQPDLTIIDATRILLRHGPTGGNLEDVEEKNTVIASTDPVLADAYAATLFNKKPEDIGYIKLAAEAGLGNINIKTAVFKEVII